MSFNVAGQAVVVVGGGRSGVAAARAARARGARVTLSDMRATIDGVGPAARARASPLESARIVPALFRAPISSCSAPACRPTQPAIEAARRGRRAGDRRESNWRRAGCSGRVIAITGTKGKSTTTTLTARMLQEAGFDVTAGGNLGTALSAQVAASASDSVHVVEVSSFQLETHRHVPSVDCGAAESFARSSRPARVRSRSTRPPRRASSRIRPRRTGPSSTPTIRRRWRSRGGGRARRLDFALDARCRGRHRRGAIDRAPHSR